MERASLHSEGKNSADGSLNVITFDASVNVGGSERERERDRQRETERQRDRETERHRDRETERQINR